MARKIWDKVGKSSWGDAYNTHRYTVTCTHTHTHTHAHARTHTHTHTHPHSPMHTPTSIRTHTGPCTDKHTQTHTHTLSVTELAILSITGIIAKGLFQIRCDLTPTFFWIVISKIATGNIWRYANGSILIWKRELILLPCWLTSLDLPFISVSWVKMNSQILDSSFSKQPQISNDVIIFILLQMRWPCFMSVELVWSHRGRRTCQPTVVVPTTSQKLARKTLLSMKGGWWLKSMLIHLQYTHYYNWQILEKHRETDRLKLIYKLFEIMR